MKWTTTVSFAGTGVALGVMALAGMGEFRRPGNHRGYSPEQPIHYSHRLHAGELGMDCRYCHRGAETSRHAGIPEAQVCMNCHAAVTAGFDAVLQEKAAAAAEGREPRRIVSAHLRKLYDALALGDDLEPDPSRKPTPVPWVRIHRVPDFVYFNHSVHVNRGVTCQTCHGPVQSMERVRQEETLSMGWCTDCHRASAAEPGPADRSTVYGDRADDHVSTDCARCHY